LRFVISITSGALTVWAAKTTNTKTHYTSSGLGAGGERNEERKKERNERKKETKERKKQREKARTSKEKQGTARKKETKT